MVLGSRNDRLLFYVVYQQQRTDHGSSLFYLCQMDLYLKKKSLSTKWIWINTDTVATVSDTVATVSDTHQTDPATDPFGVGSIFGMQICKK